MGRRSLVDNVADPAQTKNATRVMRERRNQHMADLRVLLASPAGRRVLWGLLEQCHVLHSIYDENPHRMYRLSGEQNVGHRLLADMEHAQPGAYAVLRAELMEPEPDQPDASDSGSDQPE